MQWKKMNHIRSYRIKIQQQKAICVFHICLVSTSFQQILTLHEDIECANITIIQLQSALYHV